LRCSPDARGWLEPGEAPVKTLYADFNDIDSDGNLPLTSTGSRRSVAELADALVDGEQVLLTDGDLWVYARVFVADDGMIEARGDWRFLRERPSDV